ncbi:heterokaryon incompatibility protein-domain-containing protein [Bisporella sp. PMI_857]|nr:heterokaryon incompatibility protein-domain-containing protein [Bisporella sp. PMI_857]
MNRLLFIAATGSLNIRLIRPGDTGPRPDPRSIEAYLETSMFCCLSNSSLNQNVLGKREEPISSKSDVKLSQVVDWYHQCTERHMKCTGFPSMVAPSQQLPSRLLDLGENKLRLECNVQGILNLRYATLSHVWGNDPASYLQLKEAILEAFKTEVPFNTMPIKYKDAIRITRALGIRYLWIDSLCIIQDSPKDWKTEALKMAAVYGRSACNILYTHSPSEEPAKKYLRDPRVNIPCKLTASSARPSRLSAFGVNHLWSKPLPPAAVVVQPFAGAIHGSWSTEAYRRACSLLSRAWVFQERLLCPRAIYYGHDRLLWECCETFNDEFSGPMPYVPRSKAQIYSAFSGVAQNQSLAGLRGHFDGRWKSMVNDYRSCRLTFEKDRAIAFAGIARAIQSQTGMTYLAGIWKEAVHLDLLWCVMPRGPESSLRFPDLEMQEHSKAPSWSWFSVPCQLSSDYDVVDYGLSTTVALRSKGTVYHASVLSFGHPKLPAEPEALFYDFDGLGIKLSTYKIPAGLRWENEVVQLMPRGQPMLPEKLDIFPDYDPRTAMKCNLDDLSLSVNKELPNNASMILLVFQVLYENRKGSKWYTLKFRDQIPEDNEEASDWWTRYLFSGLIVVPEESPSGRDSSWKRIGVYMFDVQGPAASIEVVLPFDFESREPDEVWLK